MGVMRAVRNTIIGIVVLLVVLVGGGFAYTYFLGPEGAESAVPEEETTITAAAQPVEPRKPAANARPSASIQSLTSPVAPGANASVIARTVPGSKCTVKVEYGGVASTDSGLAPKPADEFGTVTWTWTVGKSVPLGTWPVTITCAYNDKPAVVKGELLVEMPKP